MKRLISAIVLMGAASLAACEDPQNYEDAETMPVPIEAAPVAPSVEDQSAPVVETEAPTDAPSADTTVLPPEERPSEETVEPESETLFY